MAIVQRELQLPVGGHRHVTHRTARKAGRAGTVLTLGLGALALWLAYSILSVGLDWAHVKWDDIQYGYPRTSQTDGYIGYEEASGLPTHFIVVNAHRQVLILMIPGTDPAHVRVIPGPYLFGPGQEFSPALLQITDLNHDGYPDLVLHVAGQTLTYLNNPAKHTFTLSHSASAGAQ
jgi:hypothetical protein